MIPDDRPDDRPDGPRAPTTRFEIDRRPIAVVVASRLWRQLAVAVLLVIFAAVVSQDPPTGLSVNGWKTLCVFALCAVFWATALLPLAITSLLAMCLIPLLGVLSAEQTYSYFGSRVVFFLLGALMLSAAMIRTGLSKRLAMIVVRRFGGTPRRLVLAVFFLCAGASMVMSTHAVAVMVLPIVIDIARALGLRPLRSNLGRALCFALAWGCVIGGSLTVLGGARGPLAIGLLEEATGGMETITFLEYIAYGAPLVGILLVVGALMLRYGFVPEVTSTADAATILEDKLKEMGKVSPREQVTGLIMLVTVVAWAAVGDVLGLDTIAILAMAALFLVRAVTWKEVESEVNWGIILMYGGAICVSAAMAQSGAAVWLTDLVVGGGIESPAVLLLALAAVAALLTEFMSNAAVVAMLLPPTFSLAQHYGIDLGAATMTVVLPTNFAFMFPISTPVTALAWSAGYYTPREVARSGAFLHVVGFAVMALLILVYWPAVGLL